MPYVPRLRRWEDRCEDRKHELDAEVQRLNAFFATQPDIAAVYVFGSYANGRVGPASDLDLLVVTTDEASKGDRETGLRSEAHFRVRVDLVLVTLHEYHERLGQTSFGRTLLDTAVPLYGAA